MFTHQTSSCFFRNVPEKLLNGQKHTSMKRQYQFWILTFVFCTLEIFSLIHIFSILHIFLRSHLYIICFLKHMLCNIEWYNWNIFLSCLSSFYPTNHFFYSVCTFMNASCIAESDLLNLTEPIKSIPEWCKIVIIKHIYIYNTLLIIFI